MPHMIGYEHWRQLGGLYFAARRAVEGLWAGRHVSSRLGSGLEFHDYRQYTPGDPLAHIDWKLFGRTDRHYIRRYEQLTDLNAYVMLDMSASMNFAGSERRGSATKLTFASTLAASIAFLTVRQTDRVGLGLYADRLIHHLPPAGSMASLKRFCSIIEHEAMSPVQQPTDVGTSLIEAHALLKRRGLMVLIGDLLDDPAPMLDAMNRFLHDRFDIIVFQVLTPQEIDLEQINSTRSRLDTHVPSVKARYQDLITKHLQTIRSGCVARGVDYNLLTTDVSIVEALRRYLVKRTAAAV